MSEFNFLCPACGQNILDDTTRSGTDINCPSCQAVIVVPFPATTETTGEVPPPATPPPWTGYNAAVPVPKTSALAIASLICSLASLVTCIGWLPGIICGHMAKSRIRRDGSLKGNGLATGGLTIGYLILMLEVGTAGVRLWSLSTALKQGYENARQTLTTNIVIQANNSTITSPPVITVSNDNAQTEPTTTGWTADTSQASFPDGPIDGKIHDQDFTFKGAMLRGANLRITSANGLSVEILGLGTSVESRSYEIQTTDTGEGRPRIRMTWKEDGVVQTTTYTDGYGLKLQFGPAKKQRLSAKIYLCLPDDAKSWIAGTFNVRMIRPKQPANPAKLTTTGIRAFPSKL